MDNIEIILNQNKNVNYLGKFYNRNKLEFPILRKIYENNELNNRISPIPNNINTIEIINTIDKNSKVNENSKLDENSNKLDKDGIIMDNEVIIIKNDVDNIKPIETFNKLYIDEKTQDIKGDSYLLSKSKTIFLWLSSLIVMFAIEQHIFKNLF
jgi:hypothetical protein